MDTAALSYPRCVVDNEATEMSATQVGPDSEGSGLPVIRSSSTGPGTDVPGLDHVVDQLNAPIVGDERALHRVDRDLLEVVEVQPEHVLSDVEFFRHRRVAHQAVVGVERDAELAAVVHAEGMRLDALGRTGVNVAAQTDLQRNPLVEHVLR